MIVDCISDLHGFYPELEGGDLLIVAGDHTKRDSVREHSYFWHWLGAQKYKKQIFIAGNHDNWLQEHRPVILEICPNATYLCDSGTEFEGLKIWGTPWSTQFFGMNRNCTAFTVHDDEELADKFAKIPHDTDILITHCPPFGVLDKIPYKSDYSNGYEHVGSRYLYAWFKYVGRPKLHVFGHIHEAYGEAEVFAGYNDTMVKSVNASHVNERYEPVNKPIRIIL